MEKYNTITRKIELRPIYKYDEGADEKTIAQVKKDTWDRIRKIDELTYKIANKLVSELYSEMKRLDYADIPKSKWKDNSELLKNYYGCKVKGNPEYKGITNIVNGLIKTVYNKLYDEFYQYKIGERTIPTYKKGLPTSVARGVASDKNGGAGIGRLVTSNIYEFTVYGVKYQLHFGRDRSNNKHIIDMCKKGQYKLADSTIQYNRKKNKIYLLAVVKIPVEDKKLDYSKFIGVDLGIKTPIVASIFGSKEYENKAKQMVMDKYIKIGDIDIFLRERTKLNAQRKSLQTSLKFSRGSHGRKRKLLKLDKVRKTESNWVRTKNHLFSKQLIDYTLNNGIGNIVMEDLSGFNDELKNQTFIGRYWSYFELQTMIENKAKKYGIQVYKVNPKNTSKTCSSCGHVDADNRLTQAEFECTSCGYKMNADLNATKNIVDKYLSGMEEEKPKKKSKKVVVN